MSPEENKQVADGALGVSQMEAVQSIEEAVPEKQPSGYYDKAFEAFNGDAEGFDFSDKEASRVRWKIDLILLPMLLITYMLNFLDKGQLSNASVFGLPKDLHLHGQEYSWTSSIFYFGFLLWQYPNSIFIQKLPIGRWLGLMVFLWGLSVTASAGAKNFGTLATARFFLGVFECTNSPIFTLIVSQYYTRKEQPLRQCIWWAGGPVGAFFGDVCAYGLGHVHGSLNTWQYLFLLWGPITMLWAIILFIAVPSSPMTAWFLTERERKIAVLRVITNHTGIKNRKYKVYQVWECLRDPQAWLIFAISVLQCIPGGGLSAFNKIILTGLGYTNFQATIWSMPEHAVQLVSVILAGVASTYLPNARCISMILSNVCSMVGAILVNKLPVSHKHSRLGAVYALFTNTVSLIICLSLVSSNIAGFTKKSTLTVMIFIGYCVGQIITPQFFLSKESPSFPTGFRAFYVSMALMIVCELLLIAYLTWENRRRNKKAAANPNEVRHSDYLDLTDWEQPGFRYVW